MTTQEMVMTTQQIADRLVELCKKGDYETAQRELYADDAVSIEAMESPAFAKETHGLDAIIEKGHKFNSMVEEAHGGTVSDPVVSGNTFAVKLSMDMTMKGKGRQTMEELCVYQVKDGKIIAEQFFM